MRVISSDFFIASHISTYVDQSLLSLRQGRWEFYNEKNDDCRHHAGQRRKVRRFPAASSSFCLSFSFSHTLILSFFLYMKLPESSDWLNFVIKNNCQNTNYHFSLFLSKKVPKQFSFFKCSAFASILALMSYV